MCLPDKQSAHAGHIGPACVAEEAALREAELSEAQWTTVRRQMAERGESLVEANKLAEHLAAQRGRAKLAELLNVTERVSRNTKPTQRAHWFER